MTVADIDAAAAGEPVQCLEALEDHGGEDHVGGTGAARRAGGCALPVAGETPRLESFLGEERPGMRTKFLATIPPGRCSTPEDLGNAACFLRSDPASIITGIALEVDGGCCI